MRQKLQGTIPQIPREGYVAQDQGLLQPHHSVHLLELLEVQLSGYAGNHVRMAKRAIWRILWRIRATMDFCCIHSYNLLHASGQELGRSRLSFE